MHSLFLSLSPSLCFCLSLSRGAQKRPREVAGRRRHLYQKESSQARDRPAPATGLRVPRVPQTPLFLPPAPVSFQTPDSWVQWPTSHPHQSFQMCLGVTCPKPNSSCPAVSPWKPHLSRFPGTSSWHCPGFLDRPRHAPIDQDARMILLSMLVQIPPHRPQPYLQCGPAPPPPPDVCYLSTSVPSPRLFSAQQPKGFL